MPEVHALPARDPHAARRLAEAVAHLSVADLRLADVIDRIGPCGLRRRPGGFPRLFRSILGQQLSIKAAQTIHGRIAAACGDTVSPECVLALPDSAFAQAGVSRQKARYLRALAEIARDDPQFFDRLPRLSDETARRDVSDLLPRQARRIALGRRVNSCRRCGCARAPAALAAQAPDAFSQAMAALPQRCGLVPLRAPRYESRGRLSAHVARAFWVDSIRPTVNIVLSFTVR